MKEFTVLGFVAHAAAIVHETEEMQHHLLEVACKAVQHEAKAELGHYQQAEPPFPAWAPLAASTLERKNGMDNPLIREGDLRDSIQYSINHNVGTVGTDDPAGPYLENGTRHMPPRSFLGHAAHHLARSIVEMVGVNYALFLSGNSIYNMRADMFSRPIEGWALAHEIESVKAAELAKHYPSVPAGENVFSGGHGFSGSGAADAPDISF